MAFQDLVSKKREPVTDTVEIDGETFTVRAIKDPTALLSMQEEVMARTGKIVKIGDTLVVPKEAEVKAYVYLSHGLVVPDGEKPPSYEDIVAVSRDTGLDCMLAAIRVMELSEETPKAVDEAKNA